ncbi:metallophosphoesterase family protein [Sphingomicrobium astaxanthinifaciens]|uniref:metallophosphoesterase family protein n=1 Tax=Sphingomicrobium astaxanthinifaciens TaxID=1227949 RepID=UPI001FCC5438|nr:metallophosphoesterase family protein [Sphingomicrobium astaxanthinifaciens]MCJ7420317.1 serine/threonine protein phosphatase [Sphingomicrobium astaxanthinifaciens]
MTRFKRFSRAGKPSGPVPLKPGRRVYAIGDIHGCRAELDRLLDRIAADLAGHDGKSTLIFLGDYIDRGPDSAGVVDRLVGGALPGSNQHFLLGNHEAAMLEAAEGKALGWLAYGGIQTMESYGVTKRELFKVPSVKKLIAEHVPRAHLDFFRALKPYKKIGDYLFVHAGIRPGVSLDKQKKRDLVWIREEFLESKADHGMVVVHGHTITSKPQHKKNRIAIDTGCYASGKLTAARFEGDRVDFLTS